MGNRNAEGKVPISNWKKYLKNATGERNFRSGEEREVLEKLRYTLLEKVQRLVDLVMMEIEDQPDPEFACRRKNSMQRSDSKERQSKEEIIWSGIIGGMKMPKIYRRTDNKSK